MDVHVCKYHGNLGYGCRTRFGNWMFVPEIGETDINIYRDLSLKDLIFFNPFEKEYEFKREAELSQFNLRGLLKSLFLPSNKSLTVGGQLLLPN